MICTIKTHIICVNATPTAPITASGEPIEFMDDFTFLGSLINNDMYNGAQKDIKDRLGKARGALAQLHPIWKSNQYSPA